MMNAEHRIDGMRINERYDVAFFYNRKTEIASLSLKDKFKGKETEYFRKISESKSLPQAKREMVVASGVSEIMLKDLENELFMLRGREESQCPEFILAENLFLIVARRYLEVAA